ncbi:MAG: UbiX family flavin prenyltransferase, partial [Gammaproteobacteria bacterium]|nr:UbiX family flavin prenyltransferase [Gammaproteobacteria bacterium]
MSQRRQKITVAITGASGSAYALSLLRQLALQPVEISLLISDAARVVLATELALELPSQSEEAVQQLCQLSGASPQQLKLYGNQQWLAPVASGSNCGDAMVICPCSMGTLAAIASGNSDNLIERAADVSLKESRPLLLVPRETPYSEIHLENM